MSNRLLRAAAAVALTVAFASACTRPGSGGTSTTTTTKAPPVAVPVNGYVITGVTMNQACGGFLMANTCKPAELASDKVTVLDGNKVIAEVSSSEQGVFVIVVDAGTYTVKASSPGAKCTQQNRVVVNGPASVKDVGTLTCTT
jgi:hypothetical protein